MCLDSLDPPDPHQTHRELLRRLHLAPTFPGTIGRRHSSHDPPTSLPQPLEVLGKQGHENRARERENGVLTLHRYDAALNWTMVEKHPPRLHLWGVAQVGVNPIVV
ncbi:hypothetical protein Taro_044220 [Colocasia esculenta]|uniref:Uncharacterized protein n=1 Tax=Colocasia esculenta TaxID=4460 RepID=A0A843WIJ8_COLES|nr:hypothetical protein [Colocasia esculenta]